jgi:ABC-2 type transport system ATP-binding protein
VKRRPLDARRVSGVVFQDPAVDRALTGRRNLDIHARLWGVAPAAAADRIDELAVTLGLSDLLPRTVASYSGGERRRLEIARALVSRPRVLFLDEPTVGLDPRIRHELLEAIGRLRDRDDITILLTTHYLDEAERLCDRIAIIHSGRIIALDTPANLLEKLGRELVEVRVSGDPAGAIATLRARGLAGEDAFTVGSTLTIPLHGHSASEALTQLGADEVSAVSITTRPPTLDDVYLQLTGGRLAGSA